MQVGSLFISSFHLKPTLELDPALFIEYMLLASCPWGLTAAHAVGILTELYVILWIPLRVYLIADSSTKALWLSWHVCSLGVEQPMTNLGTLIRDETSVKFS